jgi:hypothetical protein
LEVVRRVVAWRSENRAWRQSDHIFVVVNCQRELEARSHLMMIGGQGSEL